MRFRMENMITLRGLNKKKIAVCAMDVLWLEEAEIDEKMLCNIHFNNGKWVTSGHNLEEVYALLTLPDSKSEQDESEKQRKRWKENAIFKREVKLETDAAMKELNVEGKTRSYNSTRQEDGSTKIVIIIDDCD